MIYLSWAAFFYNDLWGGKLQITARLPEVACSAEVAGGLPAWTGRVRAGAFSGGHDMRTAAAEGHGRQFGSRGCDISKIIFVLRPRAWQPLVMCFACLPLFFRARSSINL